MRLPVCLMLAAVLGCQVTTPRNAPPEDLHLALGTAELEPVDEEAPGELLVHDLHPFVNAGVDAPVPTVINLVAALAAPDSFAEPYFLRAVHGSLLQLRHERRVVGKARGLLAWLEESALAPLAIDVQLLEVPAALAAPLAERDGNDSRLPTGVYDALLDGLGDGSIRSLARSQLRARNGQAVKAVDERSRRPVVAVELVDGRPVERQQTVSDGLVLEAKVWRAAGDAAILSLEAALQDELAASERVEAEYRVGEEERVRAGVELATLRTTALRGVLRVERGAWHVLGQVPAGERVVLALARVSWQPLPELALAPLPDGRTLRALPIGLPESQAAAAVADGYVWELKTGRKLEDASGWFQRESARQASSNRAYINEVAIDNTGSLPVMSPQGLGFSSPDLSSPVLGQGAGGGFSAFAGDALPGGWRPPLPQELEALRQRLGEADWDEASALAFQLNTLFVLQTPRVVEETEELFAAVHDWKNRPVRVRAEWVEVDARLAAALASPAGLRDNLAAVRAARTLAPVVCSARSGSWTELAAAVSHAVLWGSFGDQRSSPELRALDDGAKLSVLPRRYDSGRVELDVRFALTRVEPTSLAPVDTSGQRLSQPRFAQLGIEETVEVGDGEPVFLSAGASESGGLRGLLLTVWH